MGPEGFIDQENGYIDQLWAYIGPRSDTGILARLSDPAIGQEERIC